MSQFYVFFEGGGLTSSHATVRPSPSLHAGLVTALLLLASGCSSGGWTDKEPGDDTATEADSSGDDFGTESAGECTSIGISTKANTYGDGAETCECVSNVLDGSYSQVYIETGDMSTEPSYVGYDISGSMQKANRNPVSGSAWVDFSVCYERPGGSSPNFSTIEDLSQPWVLWHTLDDSLSLDCSDDYEQYWFASLSSPSSAKSTGAESGTVDIVADFRFHPDNFWFSGMRQGGFLAESGTGSLVGAVLKSIEIIGGDATELAIGGEVYDLKEGQRISLDGLSTTTMMSANGSIQARLIGENPGVEPTVKAYDLDEALGSMMLAAGMPAEMELSIWLEKNEDGEKFVVVGSPETGLTAGAILDEDNRFALLPSRGGIEGRILDVSTTSLLVSISGYGKLSIPRE